MKFNDQNQKEFEEILTHYPTKQAAILPTLWLVQNQEGWISPESMEYVAKILELSPVHVYSVVTFYTMFHTKPAGRNHIQVCRTLSCALRGSDDIINHIKDKLSIDEGEVSSDGKFSFCTVECLASCGTAPMMMINEKYHEDLTKEKVDEILEGCS
jgi:NADH-quinone oxidoreductase subunit E